MNPQQIVVEFYLALEKATGHGNIEKARAAARAIGCKFTNSESSAWLKPFIDAASKRQDERQPFGRADGRGIPSSTAGDLGSVNGLTRGNCIPSLIPSTPTGVDKPKKRVKSQPRLPGLDGAIAILQALEPHLRPTLHGITWSDWKDRNMRALRSMATAGLTPEEVLVAWRATGLTTMAWLQNRIAERASAPRKFDPKNGCDCTLPVADCLRLHVDDGGPEWIVEIIAKQRADGVYSGSIRTPLAASAP